MPVPQYMNFRAIVLGTGKMPVPQHMNFRATVLGTGKMPVPQHMNNLLVGRCS
ncbi:hypothetical protein [Microcoleus sp. B5-D4]|uniref:hypothetical protein n=1 Tax=Microcoleus sp. B5-D4 TaxID=2818681 RepID=UPI002FD1DC80